MTREQRMIAGKIYFLDGVYPDRHSAQIALDRLKAEGYQVNLTQAKWGVMQEIEAGTNGHKYYKVGIGRSNNG